MNLEPHLQTLRLPGDTAAKLQALETIRATGNSSSILHLLPCLQLSFNESVREVICDTIIYLYPKHLVYKTLHKRLKRCDIQPADIDFFEAFFSSDRLAYLLIICALNINGHVREKAVSRLAAWPDAAAVPVLLQRLADPLKPVRQAAEITLLKFLRQDMVDAFVMKLPQLSGRQWQTRNNLGIIRQTICDFLQQHRALIKDHYRTYPDTQRAMVARLLLSYYADAEEHSFFKFDYSPEVREVMIDFREHLRSGDFSAYMTATSPRVRLKALRLVQDNLVSSLRPFIADPEANIRELVRNRLKDQGFDFTAYYLERLKNQRQLPGALSGLAETNARQHAQVVESFLNHSNPIIVKIAFFTLQKLDENATYQFCLEHMDHPVMTIRRAILDFLAPRANDTVLRIAREYYLNSPVDVKRGILHFYSYASGWAVLADIVLCTIDADPGIRSFSLSALRRWQVRVPNQGTTPDAADKERVLAMLRFASTIHEQQRFYPTNPLQGLASYFDC
ncbi:hypothetical protein [Chitinophaga qingshengii]|uniref:HEAT repeat domain-containing protein n=1 Tax=Chitinophaga qingshengii TaxID=1569794 RepID=A0ABR7TQU4_9BACT|nr:hypothetical protein [Chitinophaga qingshengii]MBC9932851.1 hypothetical protein [Chitinophaga qingshengii]